MLWGKLLRCEAPSASASRLRLAWVAAARTQRLFSWKCGGCLPRPFLTGNWPLWRSSWALTCRFFLQPVPSLATGIGEVLTPITVKATPPLLLASPGFPVSAAWAYGHWQDSPKPAPPAIEDLLAALAKGDVNAIAQLTHNDLEYCVLAKFPLLRILRQRMLDLGCLTVHVSGSGPTLFGIGPGQGLEPDALSTLTEGVPMLKTWFFPGTAANP
jgi:4-diphosphocytidyl-2C-methyl-D-erythritol kinase